MVAYSFKDRFAVPILEATKGGTIRGHRKRHARAGEALQLYQGMRTAHCKLIARRPCLAAAKIVLNFRDDAVLLAGERGLVTVRSVPALDAFARFDGFRDWDELRLFWNGEYGTLPGFAGTHIRWMELPRDLDA